MPAAEWTPSTNQQWRHVHLLGILIEPAKILSAERWHMRDSRNASHYVEVWWVVRHCHDNRQLDTVPTDRAREAPKIAPTTGSPPWSRRNQAQMAPGWVLRSSYNKCTPAQIDWGMETKTRKHIFTVYYLFSSWARNFDRDSVCAKCKIKTMNVSLVGCTVPQVSSPWQIRNQLFKDNSRSSWHINMENVVISMRCPPQLSIDRTILRADVLGVKPSNMWCGCSETAMIS